MSKDLLIIRIERCETIIFNHLCSSKQGREVLELMRRKLFDIFEEDVKKRYEKVVGKEVKEIYYDSQKIDCEIILTITFKTNIQ